MNEVIDVKQFPPHEIKKDFAAKEHYRPAYDEQNRYNQNKLLPDAPMYIDIEPSSFCNMTCLFCMRRQMDRTNEFMTMDVFNKIVREAKEMGIRGIRMIGWGEPFMHKEIITMIKTINAAGMKSHITCNGTLLTDEKIQEVCDAGLHQLYFSMQGVEEAEYAKLRNTHLFPVLRKNIYRVIQERNKRGVDYPWVQITTSVTDESDEKIKKFVEYWEQVVDKVSVSYTWTKRMEDKSIIKEWVDRSKELPHFFECNEIRAKMTIHANGTCVPCCEDYNESMYIGNVAEKSLQEIWNSPTAVGLRQVLCQQGGNQDMFLLCKDCELCHKHRGDEEAFKDMEIKT